MGTHRGCALALGHHLPIGRQRVHLLSEVLASRLLLLLLQVLQMLQVLQVLWVLWV